MRELKNCCFKGGEQHLFVALMMKISLWFDKTIDKAPFKKAIKFLLDNLLHTDRFHESFLLGIRTSNICYFVVTFVGSFYR